MSCWRGASYVSPTRGDMPRYISDISPSRASVPPLSPVSEYGAGPGHFPRLVRVCPLCPSDISPALASVPPLSFGHFPRERGKHDGYRAMVPMAGSPRIAVPWLPAKLASANQRTPSLEEKPWINGSSGPIVMRSISAPDSLL